MSGQQSSNGKAGDNSEERLLDDLAAGHLGELSRRAGGGGAANVRRAEAPEQTEEQTTTPAEKDEADAEDAAEHEAAKSHDAEVTPTRQEPAAEERQGDRDGGTGGAVEELLLAVERIAGRQPVRSGQKNPLLAPAETRRRLSLKLSGQVRTVLLQAAAVGAGAVGTLLLAWLMFA